MKVEQISIFLENKTGRLAEVTKILAETGINIRALSLADTTDFGILRILVDKTEDARKVLKERGFTVNLTSVLAVEVPDSPGGLSAVVNLMKEAGLNIEYMYAFIQKSGAHAVIIFRFDDIDEAMKVLAKSGLRLLRAEELAAL